MIALKIFIALPITIINLRFYTLDVLDAVNMDIESVPVSKLFAVVHLGNYY